MPSLETLPKPSYYFLACAVAIFVFALLQLTPMRLVENLYEDFLATSADPRQKFAGEIIVVEVQESTLKGLPYRSPLDRGFLAQLVEKLSTSGAKAIGIDILVDQASEPEKDDRLKQALLGAGSRVFIPKGGREDGLTENQLAYQNEFVADLNTTTVVLGKDRADGVVRHYLSDRNSEGQRMLQLAAAVAGVEPALKSGEFKRISYQSDESGKPFQFATYPAEAALLLPDAWFKDKYVLIGKNLQAIDQFRTPFATVSDEQDGTLPGVQVHAHILNQLLSGISIVEFGWPGRLASILLGCLAGLFLTYSVKRIWVSLSLLLSCSFVFLVAGYLSYSSFLILLPMAAAALGTVLTGALIYGVIWQQDRAEKRYIRDAWSHYVSEPVVRELIEKPEALKPGGARTEATFIFTDIEGFTNLSENLSPEILADVTNRYLDMMLGEFQRFDATLDKIVGDAIVGFIGAPLEDAEHANKAVSLALALNRKSEAFREEIHKQGIPLGKTRIGINTGHAIIGNFGGSNFFDFTAIGDAVNTASRLEGANKATGGTICVSDTTARRANQHIFRPIGSLYLKGKTEAVEAWEPMVEANDNLALDDYRAAYDLLNTGGDAAMAFGSLARKYPSDHLVQFHLERIDRGETRTEVRVDK